MHTSRDAPLRAWEKAEIGRSHAEADRISDQKFRSPDKLVARYRNPPADTPYPLEYAFHLVGEIDGKRVIDFGCGTGSNSLVLASRGANVCGIDISHDLLSIARRRLQQFASSGRARFLTASAHDLPLQDESFDLVFGIAILHHLELPLVAREVHRVLKRGGRAVFLEPVRDSRLLKLGRRLFPVKGDDVSPFERPLTTAEIAEFGAGFSRIAIKGFSLPHVRAAARFGVFKKRIDPLYRLDRALLKRYPSLEFFSAMRVIELTK